MTEILKPDICVIGAGSGGLSVAAAAAAFGVDVVLIEKGKMGGDCLNYGCVPSKAILAAGKTAHTMRSAEKFGIASVEPDVSFRDVNAHIQDVISTIAPNDSVERFTALGVKVIEDEGKFVDKKTVSAGGYSIRARRFVIATGSSAFVPPIPGLESVDYFTNETLFENKRRIRKLVVIGGGPIGMEMAQAHRRLGCRVTVVEGAKALGKDDPEMTSILLDKLANEGIEIIEGAQVSNVEPSGKSGVRVICEKDGGEIVVDGSDILVATGRSANTGGLDLEKAGITFERHGINVDKNLKTSNSRVYAIGDVAGGPQFTHVAGYHAGLVIRGILFRLSASPDTSIIPWVTYTEPELGQVGLNEEEARDRYRSIQVHRWPYHENDRAIAERKTVGHIKIIALKNGRIVGATILGSGAGEMLNMWSLVIQKKLKLKDMTGFISPYPTMSEIGKRAAVSSYAPMAGNPWVRRIISFLRIFG